MRMLAFARRNALEMLRDPLTMMFGAGFPLVLLVLLSMIQKNVPVEMFVPELLAPGIAVFGQSFLALFAALLVSRDRAGALMMRLRTSPMTAWDFILGYALPIVPLALMQAGICLLAAIPLGLELGWELLQVIAALVPSALFNIALGLICGCLFNERQVGGICGALFTNVGAWLSGIWFDPALVGAGFEKIAMALPFANAVDAAQAALTGSLDAAALGIVCIYTTVCAALAAVIFARTVHTA